MSEDDDPRESGRLDFGERLRKARMARGLRQAELARASGIPKSSVYKYERQGVVPNGERVALLAKTLRVSTLWLVAGEGDPGGGLDAEDIESEFDFVSATSARALRGLGGVGMSGPLRGYMITGPDNNGLVKMEVFFDSRSLQALLDEEEPPKQ